MTAKKEKPLNIALLGMDGRTYKNLEMFLLGPCKNAGVQIVSEKTAEVFILDADIPKSRALLEQIFKGSAKPFLIVMSLKEILLQDNALFLKKPVQTDSMLHVIAQAKKLITFSDAVSGIDLSAIAEEQKQGVKKNDNLEIITDWDASENNHKPKKVTYVAPSSGHDTEGTSKHKAAMQLDEKGFTALMGGMKDIDIDDPEQVVSAKYNPKDYFQGFVQSAYKIANQRGQIIQLNSGWKRLVIFPYTQEIWLDADDKQLRAFAGIKINSEGTKKMSISIMEPEAAEDSTYQPKQSMESFLWKLTCWTTKGYYPEMIDVYRPVYLKQWPNFTRLLLTPNAMRIAAMLIEGPKKPIEIARVLNIKLQYVFVFISAGISVELIGQAVRNSDNQLAPPEIVPGTKQGLMNRILNKLRSH